MQGREMAMTRREIFAASVAALLAIAGPSAGAVAAKPFVPGGQRASSTGADLADSSDFGAVGVAWGQNYPAAQLGAGYEDDYEVSPVPVVDLTEITSMVAAGFASYALLADGTAVAWGGGNGQQKGVLGDGSMEKSVGPVSVVEKAEGSGTRVMTGVSAIAAEWGHALAVVTNGQHEGEVMTWGASEFGERGNGEYKYGVEYKNVTEGGPLEPRSEAIAGPGLEHVVAVAAGGMSDYALQADGDKTTLWAWGGNHHGRLGTGQESGEAVCTGEGTETSCSPTPEEVDLGALDLPPDVTVTSIAAGKTAAYALLSDGRVLAWGENSHGELGDGTTESADVPQYVCAVGAKLPCSEREEYLEGVKAVSGGQMFALALLDDGEVVGWGRNQAGQLGGSSSGECANRFHTCQLTPKPVQGLAGVTAISAGASFSLALVQDSEHAGEIYSFGDGERGQLGYGVGEGPGEVCDSGEIDHKTKEPAETPCNRTPKAIPGLADASGIYAGTEKSGGAHSFAWLRNGSGPPSELSVTPEVDALTVTWRLSSPNHKYEISWKQEPPSDNPNLEQAKVLEEEQLERSKAADALRSEAREGKEHAKALREKASSEKQAGNSAEAKRLRREAQQITREVALLKVKESEDSREARAASSEARTRRKLAAQEYPYSRPVTVTKPTGPEEWSERITEAPFVKEGEELDAPLSAVPYSIKLIRVGVEQEGESAIARITATPLGDEG
jgi:alpha-tubulin suppressor-like RCC1 family protein